MIPAVVDARHTKEHKVWLEFSDGLSGEIDLADELWGPVFEPLRDVAVFAQLRPDKELDTITWPNGADFAPEFLYERLKASQSVAANTG